MPRTSRTETADELELRLRRLEDAVAALQDTSLLEERVAERVSQRVRKSSAMNFREPSVVIESGRPLMPALAVPALAATTGPAIAAVAGSAWLPWELYAEARLAGRMFRDGRYSLSPTGRYGPAVLLVGYFLFWIFTWGVPLVGGMLDRLGLAVAVLLTYKLLSREVRRYQSVVEAYNARGAA